MTAFGVFLFFGFSCLFPCDGKVTQPPGGTEYLFLPGQTGKIIWDFDDAFPDLRVRVWAFTSKDGSFKDLSLALISKNKSTEIETKLFEFGIERPATLVLKNVNQSYNGVYKFTVTSNVGDISEVMVSIANAPNVTFNCSSRNEVNEGDSFTCVCKGEGGIPPANVTWYKDGVQIGETKKENNTLTLTDVNVTDSGTYMCVAQSYPTEKFKDEKSIELSVKLKSKPYDTSITFNPQPVMVGDSVEIKCDSKGVPDPHSVIMRSGRKISTGKSYIILQVNQSHEGPYTCFAINALGNDSVADNLIVTGVKVKPNVTFNCPGRNEVNEGDSFRCVCKGEGGNPPANVTWYKDGVQIGETKKENNTLTLTDVNVTDSGTYMCVAQSYPTEKFKDEKSIELSVKLKCKTFSNDSSSGTEWYIVVVTLISGIMIGIVLSYIVWCFHRRWFKNRKPEGKHERQTTEVDTTYQELDLTKMNAEDNYQSLRVNAAASNDTGNDDDSTYTELNKARDVENNYQSLT